MRNWRPSPAEAAQELLQRRQARKRLVDFTKYTFPQYMAEPAHVLIAETLDQVVEGALSRVMIFAPPQHGKSELVSVRLPAFWLGRRPDDPVIVTSYAASLAEDKSRQARQIVESDEFERLFPDVRTSRDSRAVDHWTILEQRGGMLAAGVGGPITGHGAALGIIDDPFENWEQAQSQVYRDRTWDWYRSTFRTRVWEHGAIVLVMSRWHEDDLAGRLIGQQGEQWTIVRLPAMAESAEDRDDNNRRLKLPAGLSDALGRAPGEALAPQRFSLQALEAIQADVGSLIWAGVYQGVPRLPEGNRIKRAWFEIVDALPADCVFVRYWDKAGTEGAGKFTAGVLEARAGRTFYIVDAVRGQWGAGNREAVIRQTAELDQVRYGFVDIWEEQEPGSGGKESAEDTIANLAGFSVHADKVTGSKDVRLEPFIAQAEVRNVKLLRGDWNQAWIEEMCAVPSGTYRDQVDATAGAHNKLKLALSGDLFV